MAIYPHHVGICVTDLEKSLRFWCDGMGFETTMVPPVGGEWSDSLEVGGEVYIATNSRISYRGEWFHAKLARRQRRDVFCHRGTKTLKCTKAYFISETLKNPRLKPWAIN